MAGSRTRAFDPRIFLANMGPIPDHKPRATFAAGFFEAGGIETIGNDGFADPGRSRRGVRGCGHRHGDHLFVRRPLPRSRPRTRTRCWKRRGARTVLVAGKPGEHEEAWRSAGVTGFIHIGCDQYGMLVDLLEEEGVLHV